MQQAEAKILKECPLKSARPGKQFMRSLPFKLQTIFIVFLALPVAGASAADLNKDQAKSQQMFLTEGCTAYLESLSPLDRDTPTNRALQTKKQNFQSKSTARPSYNETLKAITKNGAQSLTDPRFSKLEQKKMDQLDAIAQTLRMREQATQARSQYYNILD